MTTESPAGEVYYQGPGLGSEMWGFSQANFLIELPGANREVAVLVNDPAARRLAEETGREDGPEFREEAARVAGQVLLPIILANNEPVDPLITVSVAFLNRRPEILEGIKRAMA